MANSNPEDYTTIFDNQFSPAEGAIGIAPYSQYVESLNNPGDTDLAPEDVRFVVMPDRTIMDLVTGEMYYMLLEDESGYTNSYRGLLAMFVRSEGSNDYLAYDRGEYIWCVADDIIPEKYTVQNDTDAQHVGGFISTDTDYYTEKATYKEEKTGYQEEEISFTFQTVTVTITDTATGKIIAEKKFYPATSHAPYSVTSVNGKVEKNQSYYVDDSQFVQWIEQEWEKYLSSKT